MHPMRALRQYQNVNSHAQISEATPHQLVKLLMQGGLDRMAQAKGAIERGDVAQKGMLLGKAVDIVGGLREGLDKDKAENPADIERLDSLYAYMQARLTEANLHTDPAIIDEVAQLLITVKSGWDEIGAVQ